MDILASIIARMSAAKCGTADSAYRRVYHRARVRATRWLMRATLVTSTGSEHMLCSEIVTAAPNVLGAGAGTRVGLQELE
jgi:hypothetical protein